MDVNSVKRTSRQTCKEEKNAVESGETAKHSFKKTQSSDATYGEFSWV